MTRGLLDAWAPIERTIPASAARGDAGPRGVDALRRLTRFFGDPTRFYVELGAWGDQVRISTPGIGLLTVTDLDVVHDLLVTSDRRVRKGASVQRAQALLGNGLITVERGSHRAHRRIVAPALARRQIEAYAPEMVALTALAADGWARHETIDMADQLARTSLRIVAHTLFGTAIDDAEVTRVLRASEGALAAFPYLSRPGSATALRVSPAPWARRLRRSRTELRALLEGVIDGQRPPARFAGDGDAPASVRELLEGAWAPDGAGAGEDGSDRGRTQLRDELMTFLLAGFETVSGALSWTFSALERYPEACDRAVAEVHDVLRGRPAGAGDLDDMPWIRAVCNEALRLNPVVYAIVREPDDGWIDGAHGIERGAEIAIPTCAIHRDARWWAAPDEFRPERWFEPRPVQHRLAFLPFGAGPRICAGNHFALQQLALMTATILQRVRPAPSDRPVHRCATFTMVPGGGLPQRLVPAGS